MSTSLEKGYPAVFGTSPKEIFDIEAKFGAIQQRLGLAYLSSSKYWSDSDLDKHLGVEWTSSDPVELDNIARVWLFSLVDKESTYRLPDLTAYLALHYPQVENFKQPALALLTNFNKGTTERPGFSTLHVADWSEGSRPAFGKFTTDADYVRFRAWYEDLSLNHRVAFSCYLALGFVQLCNRTVEETQTYLRNHAMHDFQRFWGVPANNLMWIPARSLSYLKSYFQPGSQLLVTVLRPFLRLREQLNCDSILFDSLDSVLFSGTSGKGLELVRAFQKVLQEFDMTEEQLLNELPREASHRRLDTFLRMYGLTKAGTWFWAQYFSVDFFAEFSAQQNRKAVNVLRALVGEQNVNCLEGSEINFVNEIMSKFLTRRDTATIACHEGFWDGSRRLDYA